MASKKPQPGDRRPTISAQADDLFSQITSPASANPLPVPETPPLTSPASASPPPAPETPSPSAPASVKPMSSLRPKTSAQSGVKKKKTIPDEELSPYLRRERERIRDRKPNRATYDLTPKMRQRIAALAEKYGCPQSQLVALLLAHGIKALAAGEIDPTALHIPSGSPKFAHNLDLDSVLADLDKLP